MSASPAGCAAARLTSVTLLRGALPVTPTTANLQFTRAAPRTAVHWAPAFSGSHFASAAGLPRRTQFSSQQRQLHQAIHAQSHAIAPAKPQMPPASQVWKQFESSRRSVTIPHNVEPHLYQYPAQLNMPPPARHPPPASHPAPMPRPPSEPQPSGGHPGRPPASAYLDRQTVLRH